MPTERNRYNLPREYDNYDQIQRFKRAQDRIAVTRDDEEIHRLVEDRRQQSPFLRQVSQATLIGSLAALAARKYIGADNLRRIAGRLTSMADRVRNASIKASNMTAAEYLRATGYKSNIDEIIRASREDLPQVRHLEIAQAVQDISKVYQTMHDPHNVPDSRGLLNQIVAANKKRIAERFSAGSTSVNEIQDLTVGKIMDMSTGLRKELFAGSDITAIKEGLSSGFITKDTLAGGGLFWDKAKDKFIHNPTMGQLGEAVRTISNQFNIPFTGIKFGDLLSAPVRHVLGKGAYAGVGRMPGSQSRAAVIGGELFEEVGTQAGTRLVPRGTGYKVGPSGVMAQAHAARIGELGSQVRSQYTDKLSDPVFTHSKPIRSFFMSLSELAGIGPQYRTQNSLIKGAVWDMPKRRLRGEAILKESVPLHRDAGFSDRLAHQLSENLGIDPATGKKLSTMTLGERARMVPPRIKLPSSYDDLGPVDKLKSLFGSEEKAIHVDPNIVRTPSSSVDPRLIPLPPARGSVNYGSRRLFPGDPVVGSLGNPKKSVPLQQFFYRGKTDAMYDVGHYMTTRLNTLIGATAGVGFRPTSGNITGIVGNLAKIYGAYKTLDYGIEGVKYMDYLLSVNGYSPSDAMLDLYSGARTSLQHAREMSGLSPGARYLENLMPGSVDGFLPSAVRTLGPAAVGLYKKSLPGTLIGLAAGLFVGPGMTQTPKETADILSGEQLVPIRKGRYWWLGKQPFEGGKIDYFAPGVVARARSNYKYTDTLYGTEAEYFRHTSSLPTPTNLFGLLEDKEYLKNKHQLDRPYPDTNPQASEFGRTIRGNENVLYGAYGPPQGTESKLGFNKIQPNLFPRGEPGYGKLSSGLSQVAELGGIYKFALWNMSGADSIYGEDPVLASSDFMTSKSRAFYDEQMGGMFGMSELYRRFVTSDEVRIQRNAINNIPNIMPNWLPGSRNLTVDGGKYGRKPTGQNYHIDFTIGDPYAKLKHGEFRLPGEARERMFKLHSGISGVYDPVDRFLMLADVAPHSDSFKHYRAIVQGWRSSGVLDDYWSDKIDTTQEQVKQKLARYQVYYRRFTGLALPYKMVEPSEHNMAERFIGGAWERLMHDVVPRVGIAVPVAGPLLANKLMAQRDPLEQYLKTEVYDTDDYDWTRPWPTIIRPMFSQLTATDPLTATTGGGISGLLFGANPIAKLMLATAGATTFATTSTARMATTGQLTGGYVPDYVQERREIQEYFDNLNYVKYRNLELQSRAISPSLAQYFTQMKERTVASLDYGLDATSFNRAAMKALPSRERAFFQDFVNAPVGQRKDILQYLPKYLKPVYEAAWSKSGDDRFSYHQYRDAADTRASEYFSRHGLPDSSWMGWNPGVNMRHVQVKTVDAMGNSVAEDFHRLNLFEADRVKAHTQYPGDSLDISALYHKRSGLRQDITQIWRSELLLNGVNDVTIDSDLAGGLENSISWDMKQDKMPEFFAQAQEVLRGLAG